MPPLPPIGRLLYAALILSALAAAFRLAMAPQPLLVTDADGAGRVLYP